MLAETPLIYGYGSLEYTKRIPALGKRLFRFLNVRRKERKTGKK